MRREMPVADARDGDGWSAGPLVLDQEGLATIIEAKRPEDTRRRRCVVGQRLACAAHAVARWSVDRIRGVIEPRLGDADEAETVRLAPANGAHASGAGDAANLAIELRPVAGGRRRAPNHRSRAIAQAGFPTGPSDGRARSAGAEARGAARCRRSSTGTAESSRPLRWRGTAGPRHRSSTPSRRCAAIGSGPRSVTVDRLCQGW